MNSIGVLLDLENVLHDARLQGPDAVRAGLHRVMDQLRGLGPVSWAVGVCDWWLARTPLPAAGACGVRRVVVAAVPGTLSAELALAADDTVLIELDPPARPRAQLPCGRNCGRSWPRRTMTGSS